jgi:signal transduction histidine kinase
LQCKMAKELPSVEADAVQIQQVLVNLLRNAVESLSENSDDHRHVLVRTEIVEGGVQVSVQDNGCGFDSEKSHRLFEPFYSTKAEGMGVGLAVCQSIVQAHQGRLWAEPNSDRGAKFYFTLPVCKEELHDVYCRV